MWKPTTDRLARSRMSEMSIEAWAATEEDVRAAVARGDADFVLAALRYEKSLVELEEGATVAWRQEALKGLSEKLVERLARMRRLKELHAPHIILRKEGGMVMAALGEFLGEPDPLDFKLPSYNEIEEDDDDGGEGEMLAGMAGGNKGLAEYHGLETDRPDGTGCYGCGGRGCEDCNWGEP